MELGLFFQIAGRRIQLNCSYKGSVLRIDHSCAEGNGGLWRGLCCQLGRAGSGSVGGFSGRGQGRAKVEDAGLAADLAGSLAPV